MKSNVKQWLIEESSQKYRQSLGTIVARAERSFCLQKRKDVALKNLKLMVKSKLI